MFRISTHVTRDYEVRRARSMPVTLRAATGFLDPRPFGLRQRVTRLSSAPARPIPHAPPGADAWPRNPFGRAAGVYARGEAMASVAQKAEAGFRSRATAEVAELRG